MDHDWDPEDDLGEDREENEVTPGHGIHVHLYCARIDCDSMHVIQLDEDNVVVDHPGTDAQRYIKVEMPDGWGYDRHDGINPALHCPNHRKPPTKAEIAAANASLHGTELTVNETGDLAESAHNSARRRSDEIAAASSPTFGNATAADWEKHNRKPPYSDAFPD